MPEPRLCEVCSSVIPEWKAKNVSTCSVRCKFQLKQAKAQSKRKERIEKNPKRSLGSVLHSCLANSLDPAKPCRCRKRVIDDEASRLVAKGEAVNFESRLAEFIEGAPILLVGRSLKFPRSATLEKAHLQRLTERKKNAKDKTLEELQKAVQEDRAMRAEEEALRLEVYGELTLSAQRALVVEVPAEEYDRLEREQSGISILSWFEDERSAVGVDVPSISFEGEEEIEETVEDAIGEVEEQSEEIVPEFSGEEAETEAEVEDERTADEVLAEHGV